MGLPSGSHVRRLSLAPSVVEKKVSVRKGRCMLMPGGSITGVQAEDHATNNRAGSTIETIGFAEAICFQGLEPRRRAGSKGFEKPFGLDIFEKSGSVLRSAGLINGLSLYLKLLQNMGLCCARLLQCQGF